MLPSQLERINRGHLRADRQVSFNTGFGNDLLHSIRREELRDSLDRKRWIFSSSVVSHLRWFLNGIFKLALSECTDSRQPGCGAEDSKEMSGRPSDAAADGGGGKQIPGSRRLREKLIARLAIFEGMGGSNPSVVVEGGRRRDNPSGGERLQTGAEPAEELQDPQRRDLRRRDRAVEGVGRAGARFVARRSCLFRPRRSRCHWTICGGGVCFRSWKRSCWDWATFQVLRKTDASLSKEAGVDPKVASHQKGHGIGVGMDGYTSSDMEQKRAAVNQLDAMLQRPPVVANGQALMK